jgi:predicted metalloenzyme YecM
MLDLYLKLLDHIELKYKEELKRYIPKETWDFYQLLLHGTEEEVWQEYGAVLADLEDSTKYNHNLFMKAKKLMKKFVQNGWMTEKSILF